MRKSVRLLIFIFVVVCFSAVLFLTVANKADVDTFKCPPSGSDVYGQSTGRFKDDVDKDGIRDAVEMAHDVKIFGADSANWPDPYHADLFIELDTQKGYVVPLEVKKGAIDFYANLNLCNPDGTKGIRLHIDDVTSEFYFGGGQFIAEPDAHLYPQLTMMAMHEDAAFFSLDRCGIFRYGLVLKTLGEFASEREAIGLGDAPGDKLYLDGESMIRNYKVGIVVLIHELGHNILGQLDEMNWDGNDSAHDPYGDFMFYAASGSNIWAHANVVAELTRDGLLGLPRRCR